MQLLPGGPASPLGPEKGKIILQKKLQDKHVPIVECLSAPTFSTFIFLCAL